MTNSNPKENKGQDDRTSQNPDKDPKSTVANSNPYDSENLDQESDSDSKDITEKDIEKDLIENDPSKGFETNIDTQNSNSIRNLLKALDFIPMDLSNSLPMHHAALKLKIPAA